MIPGPLLRVGVKRDVVLPAYVGDKPAANEAAEVLLGLFRAAVEDRWSRERIDESVTAAIGDSKDHKLWRGLAKVLADRSEFEVAAIEDPAELRLAVFRRAREVGPISLEAGPLGRKVAGDVLAEFGAARGVTSDAIAASLYADRHDEQRITACDVPDPAWLVRRYDVALAQSVLLHAVRVTVSLDDPTTPRLRQLLRWVKFHQLTHSARRVGKRFELVLDGPMSLFSQSTRYGLQLASFLPALLLQPGKWSLVADVRWTQRRLEKRLELSHDQGLVSHLVDHGAWTSREQEWFIERFTALKCDWKMSDRTDPILLDGKSVVLPDFAFESGGRTAFLEIVGYWRKDWLTRRMEALEKYAPGNLILAVSRKLLGSEDGAELLERFPGAIVPFATMIPAPAVLAAIEKVAS